MRYRDNKKLKVTLTVLLLMLVLGAAFAFTPGRLTIGGAVNFEPDDLYLQFRTASTSTTDGVRSAPPVINEARDRNRQHVEWEVTFETPGTASMNFDAQNHSHAFNALIGELRVSPSALETSAYRDFGITFSGNYMDFEGTVVPRGGISDVFTLNIHWNGRVPDWFDPNNNPSIIFELSYGYTAID